MVLTVFLSSRISPRTSTVILRDFPYTTLFRSTSAMFRTWLVRLLAMELTLSVRSFQVPATPRTSAWPPSFPSLPTSRATRVTSEANDPSWSTIVLTVFFNYMISPRTSTVILRERSPRTTAVVTSAMFRSLLVALPILELTLSVRSFQVPATPRTSAWPPSFPSLPTSRATRVTSEANDPSWSTIVLTVFFNYMISPRTSTVILRERSPRTTAVVTSAMFRSLLVALPILELTLSVRSFQVPATPRTSAWPPSFPSLPTSRATRVTSEANDPSWSTIVLTVFFNYMISPRTSTVILRERSPRTTAVVTSAMFRSLLVALPILELTLSVRSFQVPATPRTSAWPPSFPSLPTSRATRVTSEANDPSWSTIVLTVFFNYMISPRTSTVILRERSPRTTAVVTSAMFRSLLVALPILELTLSVRSFQVPATPRTSAWPPSLPSVPTSRATRVTSEANDPSWSTIVLTVWPTRRNSPLRRSPSCSSGIRWERSPFATAPITRATSSVGRTRSPMSVFIESIRSDQAPVAAPTLARWVIRPSLPTTLAIRAASRVPYSSRSATSLNASAIAAPTTDSSTGRRTLKSPLLRVFNASRSRLPSW